MTQSKPAGKWRLGVGAFSFVSTLLPHDPTPTPALGTGLIMGPGYQAL